MRDQKERKRALSLKLSIWAVCGIFLAMGWGSLSEANGWDEPTPAGAVYAMSSQYTCGIDQQVQDVTSKLRDSDDPYCNQLKPAATAPLCKSISTVRSSLTTTQTETE